MLKPALLYAEELKKKEIEIMYDTTYQFYNGGMGMYLSNLADNSEEYHQFVSIIDNRVVGYITYRVNCSSMIAHSFGIISFEIGNIRFIREVKQVVDDIFYKYNLNKLEFCAYADNPAIRGYRNFIKKHGGKECGYFRQSNKLMDGKLHDSVCFEIMKEEYKKHL